MDAHKHSTVFLFSEVFNQNSTFLLLFIWSLCLPEKNSFLRGEHFLENQKTLCRFPSDDIIEFTSIHSPFDRIANVITHMCHLRRHVQMWSWNCVSEEMSISDFIFAPFFKEMWSLNFRNSFLTNQSIAIKASFRPRKEKIFPQTPDTTHNIRQKCS